MEQLNYISNLFYGMDYCDLEPHQQNEVYNAMNNPDY